MKFKRITIIFFLTVALILPEIKTNAEESNKIAIYQVLYGYRFEDESFDTWVSIPGVAINNRTVIAVFDPFSAENYKEIIEERYDGYATLGIDLNTLESLDCVVYDGDETLIPAETDFTEDGYVILSTEEDLEYVSHFSTETYSDTEQCSAVGLPQSLMDLSHYASMDDILYLTITEKNTDAFEIASNDCMICVIDENYGILGIVTGKEGGKYKVIDGSKIKEALTVRYIGFNIEENVVVDTEKLEKAIKEAEEIKADGYTKESYKSLTEELENAKTIIETGSQSDIDREVRSLTAAISSLKEEKVNIVLIIVVGLIMLIVTGLIIFLFIKFVFKKSPSDNAQKNKPQEKVQNNNVSPRIPNPRTPLLPPPQKDYPEAIEKMVSNAAAGTSVLVSNSIRTAYIERTVTGEMISVEGFPFTIGRGEDSVYCIQDNDTISGIHCIIACINGEYNVFDNDSTNGTYVDGYKIVPLRPFPLKDGSIIMISNETLVFHVR